MDRRRLGAPPHVHRPARSRSRQRARRGCNWTTTADGRSSFRIDCKRTAQSLIERNLRDQPVRPLGIHGITYKTDGVLAPRTHAANGSGLSRFNREKIYFLNSERCRCSLTAVVRKVSGTFLLVHSRLRSMALIIGSMCRLTSSGVFGLFKRLRTTA
jgi:hypothetical protein